MFAITGHKESVGYLSDMLNVEKKKQKKNNTIVDIEIHISVILQCISFYLISGMTKYKKKYSDTKRKWK